MNGKKFAMLLLTALSAAPILAAADDASGSDAPIIVKELVDKAPSHFGACLSTARARCSEDARGWPPSKTCDVVKYQGVTYWPMSFDDNRYAILAAGVPETSALTDVVPTKVAYAAGTRYIWKVEVDQHKKTVTFWGQGNSSASLSWDQLKNAPSVPDCQPTAPKN